MGTRAAPCLRTRNRPLFYPLFYQNPSAFAYGKTAT